MFGKESTKVKRYHTGIILLHWLMALGFFLMLGSGITMSYFELEKSLQFKMYQWHKSGGVILFIAFFLRVSWRLFTYIPALPDKFPAFEVKAAKLGHLGLYCFMLAMPITGWIMVSSSVYGLPTIVFGWFKWPHIPNIQGNETIHELAEEAHFFLAIGFGLMILTHVLAVIKHKVKDNENLLKRLWWR